MMQNNEWYQSALNAIGDAVCVVNDVGRVDWVNDSTAPLFGYERDEVVGRKFTELFEKTPKTLLEPKWLEAPSEFSGKRKNGESVPLEVMFAPLEIAGRIVTLATLRDISERRRRENQIRRMTTRDPVTGLYNRHMFEQMLDTGIEQVRIHGGRIAVLRIGLNEFKGVNDAYGHSVGDEVLTHVADRIGAVVGEGGVVSHFGGPDFGILVHGSPEPSSIQMLTMLVRHEIEQPMEIGDREVYTSASFGVCTYPENSVSRVDLLDNADTAMNTAKHHEPGGFRYYSMQQSEEAHRKVEVERNLRRAVEREEFRLLYQPKVDLMTGTILGCEALLRWNNPALGGVSPDEFIPIAEMSGLIVNIGQWVLEEACRQGAHWNAEGAHGLRMGINLSPRQFISGDLASRVFDALETSRLDPRHLDLEITETSLVENTDYTIAVLREIKQRGVTFSMDDFGTGYSSLSYLRQFPLDHLKVDRSFVSALPLEAGEPDDRGVPDVESGATMVRTIANMAGELGFAVIAEGIETVAQQTFLRELGCEMGQGFLYGRPLEPVAFEELYRRTRKS